ncbi:MAG: peptidoglycan-associated lipoprotein Pal [Rhodobacteraceae bacterium]|nr:peptidoglycan-associated lipoprotein Pal [Paracoccaceae bacterium]
MRILSKVLVVGLVLGIAGCTNAVGGYDSGLGGPGASGNPEGGLISDQTSAAYFQQAIGDRVLFPVNLSTLTDESRATLVAQADWMSLNTDYKAIIEGHADEQGTREYNIALGARRADTVREFLISRGVAGNRLQVVSFGKERPLEICSDETCYSKNRRAVTVLAGGLTG